VDAEGVEANYRDGVLTLNVPKVAAVQPRRIAVKS
jgi:HSP20 family molecular chaperone IbpA